MIRHFWITLFLITMVSGMGSVWAVSLPVWSDEDLVLLRKGDLIPGADILVEPPAEIPLPLVAPEPEVPPLEPAEPIPDYDPQVIPQEYLSVYFSSSPEGYLIDPQRLLSMQESLDREGFLEYHAEESEIDIRMYLFDAQQQIPAHHTIQKLCQEHYAGEPLTAVIFFFLGDPSRNQVAFGGDGAADVTALEVRKMLESAKIKAMEKSDPSAQIESFIVQLSIRLYWLERERTIVEAVAAVDGHQGHADGRSAPDQAAKGPAGQRAGGMIAGIKAYLAYILAGIVGLSFLCCGLALGWSMWMRKRRYHFQILEVPERLGASYAAGVGAVLAFHNKLGSPSSQRDQVPDYLTRI